VKSQRLIIALLLLLPALPAWAEYESSLRDAGLARGMQLATVADPEERKVYIVQLRQPSTAEYHASLLKSAGILSIQKGARPRFDPNSAALRSYADQLLSRQQEILARAAPDAEKIYSYRFGLNGFAARMTAAQAHKLENQDDVLHVWEDEIRPLTTNFSPGFLKLFDGQKGLRGPEGLTGAGVVIGFIDSGIYPEHPALNDTKEADRPSACRGSWADNTLLGRWLCKRFDRMDDQLVFEPPENWNGACEAGEQFEETSCNNKLIGARWFISGADNSGPIDSGEIRSARDVDGHGTHTATTAAGNRVSASIFGTLIGSIEGIAPRARIAVYKACWLRPQTRLTRPWPMVSTSSTTLSAARCCRWWPPTMSR
jgi:subtilisin family serine protease